MLIEGQKRLLSAQVKLQSRAGSHCVTPEGYQLGATVASICLGINLVCFAVRGRAGGVRAADRREGGRGAVAPAAHAAERRLPSAAQQGVRRPRHAQRLPLQTVRFSLSLPFMFHERNAGRNVKNGRICELCE